MCLGQFDSIGNQWTVDSFIYELIFGGFKDQPILPDYYNLLNDNNEDGNNIHGTHADDVFLENEGVEEAVVQNDKEIYNDIIIDDDDSLASYIDPIQNEIM